MAHKARVITLRKVLGPPPAPKSYRIVIEGIAYGDADSVKHNALEEIEAAIDAHPITGAAVIYVTTLRGPNANGKLVLPESDASSRTGRIRPGSHRTGASEQPTSGPGAWGGPGSRGPYKKRPTAEQAKRRSISALMAAAKRNNWPAARLAARIAEVEQGLPPQRERSWEEINKERKQWGMLPREQQRAVNKAAGQGREPGKRMRRRPRGTTVVEVLPNGTRVLSDGSRITPSGRLLSREGLEALRARAEGARAKRAETLTQSFSPPSEATEATPQREPNGEPRTQFGAGQPADEQARWEALVEREAEQEDPRVREYMTTPPDEIPEFDRTVWAAAATENVEPQAQPAKRPFLQRVLGYHAVPEKDVDRIDPTTLPEPVDRPDIPQARWDVIVSQWLDPNVDPFDLCRTYHITRAQLDHELQRRGISPYRQRTQLAGIPERKH